MFSVRGRGVLTRLLIALKLLCLDCRCVVTEIEKFIMANTQELAKDKWLCPLSGKKFKGPEFVRKHILTKHMEKLDELKKEASFIVSDSIFLCVFAVSLYCDIAFCNSNFHISDSLYGVRCQAPGL